MGSEDISDFIKNTNKPEPVTIEQIEAAKKKYQTVIDRMKATEEEIAEVDRKYSELDKTRNAQKKELTEAEQAYSRLTSQFLDQRER